MKKILLLSCCLVLTVLMASCKKTENSVDPDAADGSPDTSPDFSYSYEEPAYIKQKMPDTLDSELSGFDLSLADYIYSNGYYNSNFVVSPAAFRASLCIAAEGAENDTLTQLTRASGFSDAAQLDLWCRYFQNNTAASITALAAKKEALGLDKPPFTLYNSIWSSEDRLGSIAYSYKVYVEGQLNAEAYSCASDELSESLDQWISDKTGRAIPKTGKDVTEASTVLASAVYLETLWQNSLEISVSEDIFTDISGTESMVSYIELTGEFLYANENGTQILALPLEGDMSLVCLCGDRTAMFEKLSELNTETLHVMIPEFEICSLFDADDLMNYLISRGAVDALIGTNVDFSGICDEADWFLQEMLQISKISVGAGALPKNSGNSEANVAYNEAEIIQFKADSPFSFAVISDIGKENQQLLLYGQLTSANE